MKSNTYDPEAFPSHGRGRRFNPCSAHHFTGDSSAEPGTDQQPSAPAGTLRRGQDVEDVRQAFLTWCRCKSLAGWPQEVDDAAARVHLSLTACADYPELSVFTRALADDVVKLDHALTHSSRADSPMKSTG